MNLRKAPSLGRVATFSRGIARLAHGVALIGCDELVLNPQNADGIDAVVGWGLKDNTIHAIQFAHRNGLPYFRLEDGFLRSIELGVNGGTALSMVLDDQSIYYDARQPSRLETMLESDDDQLNSPELMRQAQAAIDAICQHGLSKYNESPVESYVLPDTGGRKRVLVVDQTAGDLSVACGLGRRNAFSAMLAAALEENPDAEIIVKTHPDVVSGKKRGYLGANCSSSRVTVLTEACNPIFLLEQVDKVYVVTSQLGFEALLVGKSVVCFGVPFYSGWGLTDDRQVVKRRTQKRTLEQVFAAAYLLYSRYVDPDTGKVCGIEKVIEHLALQRQEFSRNTGRIFCFGFRFWKRGYVRAYLRCPGNEIHFPRSVFHAVELGFDKDSKLLAWGQRAKDQVSELSHRYQTPIWRMEDGFLRSVGLGSDMATPASLVVDRLGIYYDPTGPSELESILQEAEFPEAVLHRAAKLRVRLVDSGLSKYNVGDHVQTLQFDSGDRQVVLVAGQVEDDASIQLGCQDVNTNLGLLRAARAACPDAFLIFKPHPDVLSGNRVGNVEHSVALGVCDHIEEDASLAKCLEVADQVHVMSSLVGFEALLRGLDVHAYGQPFYAGWGLTVDRHPVERRTRKLSLDQLVAATYILYPRYLNRQSFRFTSAEAVIDQLEIDRAKGGQPLKVSFARRQLRKLKHITGEMTRGS